LLFQQCLELLRPPSEHDAQALPKLVVHVGQLAGQITESMNSVSRSIGSIIGSERMARPRSVNRSNCLSSTSSPSALDLRP
jgi:hypothetical protein